MDKPVPDVKRKPRKKKSTLKIIPGIIIVSFK